MESLLKGIYPHYFTLCWHKYTELQNEHLHSWRIISHYLHKHNELALQGLGVFTSIYQPVCVDPVAKTMMPASKTLMFTASDCESTPAFLLFYKDVSGLAEHVIVNKLQQLATHFHQALSAGTKYDIEGFGVFNLEAVSHITFKVAEGLTFVDESFGLTNLHFAANLNKVKRIVVEKAIVPEHVEEDLNRMRESALRELKILLDQAKIAENIAPVKNKKIFPIVATVLTMVLLVNLALFLFKNPVSPLGEQVSKMDLLGKSAEILDSPAAVPVQAPVSTPVAPEVLVQPTQTLLPDSINMHVTYVFQKGIYDFDSSLYSIQPLLAEPNPPLTVNENTTEPLLNQPEAIAVVYSEPTDIIKDEAIEKGYYLIAGAFKGEKKAHKLISELIGQGHANPVIIKPSGYHYNLVAYKKFTTLEEAKLVQEKTQEDENWDVWIYTCR